MAWTTPRTWVTNETATASNFNVHVRDNLNALYGTTTTYTPQIDQGVTTNIAKTVTEARYVQTGRIVDVWFQLALTAAGTAGSAVSVTLPVTASGHSTNVPVGEGLIFDTSTSTRYQGVWELASSTTLIFGYSQASASAWGAVPSIALASGDSLRGHVRYIVA